MLTNLSIVLITAILLNALFNKFKLPGLLGMIATGIILGPSVLNFISEDIRAMSSELKTAALIVILIRAGLGINRETLNKVGLPAIKMSCIPGILEGTILIFAIQYFLNFTLIEAGILGFIIAAVSPAVVVPQMLELKELGFGQNKEIPTLVLAGASVDDVFAITIFGVFIGLAGGTAHNIASLFITVPAGILLGIVIGVILGFTLIKVFKTIEMRDTRKVIIFMIVAIIFHDMTELKALKELLPIASLLGIMAMGFIILEKQDDVAKRLASKFNKIWVLAELLLFILIGSQVRIELIDLSLLSTGIVIIIIGLTARSAGVWISLIKSKLNTHERLFCIISYLPKATVQAAIGAVPLALVNAGQLGSVTEATAQTILAISVLSIIITAPLGAIGIKLTGHRLLQKG